MTSKYILFFGLCCCGNLGWCFARKSFYARCSRFSQSKASLNKALQHRYGFASTGQFVSCAFVVCFAKYSTTHNLQTAAELGVRRHYENKMYFIASFLGFL
jgi:hypothetical protein